MGLLDPGVLSDCGRIIDRSYMWRRCDLHNHTTPNEQDATPFNARLFVADCVAEGLDVVAVTDHDSTEHVDEVTAAAQGTTLAVIPGVEISTDRGHIIAIAPDPKQGLPALVELCDRLGVGAEPQQEPLSELLRTVRENAQKSGKRFSDLILLIGSHADQDGSLLAARQALALEEQARFASNLDALEVVHDLTLQQWSSGGIKGTGVRVPLLRGSDSHVAGGRVNRSTWLYLPQISFESVSHALATPESSIRLDGPGSPPQMVIESVSFVGGLHNGLTFRFSERTNAIIGPPLSGKSLIIDALRFAFGQTCPVDEIARVCASRLERRLGQGSRVIVKGRGPHGAFTSERIWGGAQEVMPPFSPIIFSQTELVRRGIEEHPSMALVDVHAPVTSEWKTTLSQLTDEVEGRLQRLVELAAQASDFAMRVENPEDGLTAVNARIKELAGTEALAQKENDLSRVRGWRERTKERAQDWLGSFDVPEPPTPASPPQLTSEDIDVAKYIPSSAINGAAENYRETVENAAKDLRDKIDALIHAQEAALTKLEGDTATSLKEQGVQFAETVLNELQTLRQNLAELEETNAALTQIRTAIEEELQDAKDLIARAESIRASLRKERKRVCTDINASMPDFFARLEEDFYTTRLDALIEDAKVGTGRWKSTLEEVRGALDRARLIEVAVRSLEGRPDSVPQIPALETQDQVAAEAMRRGKTRQLAEIVTLWPGDGLVLTDKGSGDPFGQLTEGMRALAIKEISFAANQLPVISDQPEDAVPPEAVYGKLVPTLRTQRAERQFIFASHDANLVVAGDVEQIVVLGSPGQPPEEGTLFRDPIREAAMQLLEGGKDAFALRGKRYRSGG